MFKLIAIRPLKGCSKSVLKCLKEGQFYYFCNDYIITENGIKPKDKYIRPLPHDFFSLKEGADLQVNVSAIVGMNGDGKSSLIELMMRLINNCAKYYKLYNKNNLLRIEGVKAELYYELDGVIYCIKEAETDTYTGLFKYADIRDAGAECWARIMEEEGDHGKLDMLFYTIVSNYSHYSYNINDFKDEWVEDVQVKENCERCWLYYIFHKNDGYLTPITIHPYRDYGNIDVNRETELTIQRLIALYIQELNPKENEHSFRRIGEKDANILCLTDVGYSKLRELTIVEYFKTAKMVSSLSKIIGLLEDAIREYDSKIAPESYTNSLIRDAHLPVIEDCLDFLTGVNDLAYQKFLSRFYGLLAPYRKVYSSKSDIRVFLKAMLMYRNNVDQQFFYHRFADKYKRYDKLNVRQLVRLRFVYGVMQEWEIPVDLLFVDYDQLSDIERCQHYIVYKTVSICETYPEYRDYLDEVDYAWNNVGLLNNDGAIHAVTKRIKKDTSHVTLKLRQCLKYIERRKSGEENVFERLNCVSMVHQMRGEFEGSLMVKFDDLRSYYSLDPFPLDCLPPAIYKVDVLYQSTIREEEFIPFRFLSSGEKQMLNSFGALIYHLRNIDSVSISRKRYDNVNIILEEIELYFHPEYQRKIVKTLLDKIQAISFKNIKRVNITFVTHSPFILSDIPLSNVLFLKEGRPRVEIVQENTFGANIHGMLRNGFFLPSLPMGEFAYEKINNLFNRLNGYKLDAADLDQRNWFYSSIMRVGEPYLREQLMKLFNMHYPYRRENND